MYMHECAVCVYTSLVCALHVYNVYVGECMGVTCTRIVCVYCVVSACVCAVCICVCAMRALRCTHSQLRTCACYRASPLPLGACAAPAAWQPVGVVDTVPGGQARLSSILWNTDGKTSWAFKQLPVIQMGIHPAPGQKLVLLFVLWLLRGPWSFGEKHLAQGQSEELALCSWFSSSLCPCSLGSRVCGRH